ncbi:MAG: substrate-binding domain-containing protein [Magnetovibrio sp.]|nr:substrate-binding domain-containing protein [Magnetovibrio sp.]
MTDRLPWPREAATDGDPGRPSLAQPDSNICLDFHGDPARAGLVVYSDGNHHMALEACAARFLADNPDAVDVFYATTPPGPLLRALDAGGLDIGNLTLSRAPHVFVGPPEILDKAVAAGRMETHAAFAESRGNALLVRTGNPENIAGAADLMRDDIVVAISNPVSEAASFQVYADTLMAQAGADGAALRARLETAGPNVVHSRTIHHREVPQLIAAGRADVAMVYYHLALRYTRIFPDAFEIVDADAFEGAPAPGQQITAYHLGLIDGGGDWGGRFQAFMHADVAASLYEEHGLRSRSA